MFLITHYKTERMYWALLLKVLTLLVVSVGLAFCCTKFLGESRLGRIAAMLEEKITMQRGLGRCKRKTGNRLRGNSVKICAKFHTSVSCKCEWMNRLDISCRTFEQMRNTWWQWYQNENKNENKKKNKNKNKMQKQKMMMKKKIMITVTKELTFQF